MNSQPERAPQGTGGTLEPVGPSRIVKIVMRPMTKMLNPLIVKLAGRRHFHMAAQIRHVGRRSGRTYITPVSARRSGDTVVIALTFGNQSDWSRNVRAAGGGIIRIDGEDFDVSQPQVMSRREARPLVQAAFSPMDRAGFRMLGIKQVMILRVVSAQHLPGPAADANARIDQSPQVSRLEWP
jgi:deazaflavin-dependent oxidoreductase (nitroreductase family)